MSDDPREAEIATWGSGADRPARAPSDASAMWLRVITAGVLVIAACSVVTAWTVVEMREDGQLLDCYYRLGVDFNDPEDQRSYEDLNATQRAIADRLDCDLPGR